MMFVNYIVLLVMMLFFLVGPSFLPGFFVGASGASVFRFGFAFGLFSPYVAWCVYTDYRKLVRRRG